MTLIEVIGAAVAGLAGVVGGGGLMGFVVKKLVASALENMNANTVAIKETGEAMTKLAASVEKNQEIRDERDRSMFKQLDRMETYLHRRDR